MSWQNRIVGYANVPTNELQANPRNWRVHNKRQEDTLADVLGEVGIVQNIVVNQRTGLVVDGHLRLALATKQGQAEVPVTYIDVTEEEEAIIMATFDPVGSLAATDKQLLQNLLDTMPALPTWQEMFDTIIPPVIPMDLPPLVPITYDNAAERQPVDKSKNLLGDALSTTYKEPKEAKPAKQPWEYDYEKDDPDDDVDDEPSLSGQPAKLNPSYTPRIGEVWMIDTCHRVFVTDNAANVKWVDPDWRPIKPNKSPHRMIDLMHRMYLDTQIDAIAEWRVVSCTDAQKRHTWYQVALRPDQAAMLIALADDMRISSEMM
jgi:hypothetical protein